MPSLQDVDNYPLPELLIPRVAKEHGYCLHEATALVREAKRMLYLHSVSKEPVCPSLNVDDAWHEMLMFTRFYKDFADYIGVFVHHDPTPGTPDGGRMYARTKENYKTFFGEKADDRFWG